MPTISDDDIVESIEQNQLRIQHERGVDLTLFSARAGSMGHHLASAAANAVWSAHCNDLIARVVDLFPADFRGVAQLPQAPGVSPVRCVAELQRCVEELGFVGCIVNPDPTGGWWTDPPVTDRHWYPLWEALVERLVIPHGGGAVPYHWGRYRGLALDMGRVLEATVLGNVFFDTCVYHQAGIDLLVQTVPSRNVLFGSEIVGAVRSGSPETGRCFDDTLHHLRATPYLTADERNLILDVNAYAVYRGLRTPRR